MKKFTIEMENGGLMKGGTLSLRSRPSAQRTLRNLLRKASMTDLPSTESSPDS